MAYYFVMVEETQPAPQTSNSGYSNKRPLWQWILLYVIIGVIAYGLLYYFVFAKKGNNYQQAVTPTVMPPTYHGPSATPTASNTPQASPSSSTESSKQQFTVVGSEFSFSPPTITVKQNSQVSITFKNEGKYPHNLTITNLSEATKTIDPGQSDTITFVAAKKGTFPFMCTVDSHAQRGMTGTLTVE